MLKRLKRRQPEGPEPRKPLQKEMEEAHPLTRARNKLLIKKENQDETEIDDYA